MAEGSAGEKHSLAGGDCFSALGAGALQAFLIFLALTKAPVADGDGLVWDVAELKLAGAGGNGLVADGALLTSRAFDRPADGSPKEEGAVKAGGEDNDDGDGGVVFEVGD